jgi:subtilisin family serine protease
VDGIRRHRPRLLVLTLVASMAAIYSGAGWGAGVPAIAGANTDAATRGAPLGASWGSRPPVSVIVRARPGAATRLKRDVIRLGGTVGRDLAIIDGFSAKVPARALPRLRALPGILSATRDSRIEALSSSYSPVSDLGSPYNVTQMTGAQQYWKAGYTGKGIDIALIDSGVVPVDGLTAPGKVVNGPDLSLESQAPNLRYLDTFGHGTHMAGIIAGRANAAVSGAYDGDSQRFLGMAPDARLISIKVADAQGATDVSQVIAAIDWVVQHRNDPGVNIRVLSLSYGTDSTQYYGTDPLAFAAEQAVKAGILVVAAAGNDGFSHQGTLTNPAYDPHVLAVGATESKGTLDLADDQVPSYSSTGDTGSGRKSRDPDLVAPGSHIVSLRAPGSYVDQTYGGSGLVTSSLFRGSGTSQAAAVVSGAAALVIQQRPGITPYQLKQLLMRTATLQKATPAAQGQGELDLAKAFGTPTPTGVTTDQFATGTGSLDASRGSVRIVADGVTLSGEKDIFGMPFDSTAMALLESAGSSWSGGLWNGSSWSGSSWSGSSWSGSSWSGSSWSGSSWSGSSWSGASWSGSSWSGSSWSGSSWSGSSWSGDYWANAVWSGADWK